MISSWLSDILIVLQVVVGLDIVLKHLREITAFNSTCLQMTRKNRKKEISMSSSACAQSKKKNLTFTTVLQINFMSGSHFLNFSCVIFLSKQCNSSTSIALLLGVGAFFF